MAALVCSARWRPCSSPSFSTSPRSATSLPLSLPSWFALSTRRRLRSTPSPRAARADDEESAGRRSASVKPEPPAAGGASSALWLLSVALAPPAVAEEAEKAVAESPGWLGPAVLLFPLLAYAGFSVFREKVNPRASILDFLFLLVALFIILNVITIVTLGIRLY